MADPEAPRRGSGVAEVGGSVLASNTWSLLASAEGYGECTEFRDELETRDLRYVVGIGPNVGVWTKPPKTRIPEYGGRGARPTRRVYGDQRPVAVRDVALKAKGWKKVRWREGSKGWLESRFLAWRVQPSHGFVDGDPPHKQLWLLVEWPAHLEEPAKYFPSGVTQNRPMRDV